MKAGWYYSKHFNGNVYIHIDKYNHPYDVCQHCGKPLKTVYSVTPESDGLEYLYGNECIKNLGLYKIKE